MFGQYFGRESCRDPLAANKAAGCYEEKSCTTFYYL